MALTCMTTRSTGSSTGEVTPPRPPPPPPRRLHDCSNGRICFRMETGSPQQAQGNVVESERQSCDDVFIRSPRPNETRIPIWVYDAFFMIESTRDARMRLVRSAQVHLLSAVAAWKVPGERLSTGRAPPPPSAKRRDLPSAHLWPSPPIR